MKYFKTDQSLVDIFSRSVLKQNEKDRGFIIGPNMQVALNGKYISYGKIIDEKKCMKSLLSNATIKIFDSVEDAQRDIDSSYKEELKVSDSILLQLDLQLSNKAEIKGYNSELPITSQFNLKKLKEAKMGGIIVANKKIILN